MSMPKGTKLGWVVSTPLKRRTRKPRGYAHAQTAIANSVQHVMTTRCRLVTINGPRGEIVNVIKRSWGPLGKVVLVEY